MLTHEQVGERIAAAVAVRDSGDRELARAQLDELWNEIGADPIHRCVAAHHTADSQDDLHLELSWDLCALEAANEITIEQRKANAALFSVDAFYPSLHLNLARDYWRLGRAIDARQHLLEAIEWLRKTGDLPRMGPDTAYGRSLREDITQLATDLDIPV